MRYDVAIVGGGIAGLQAALTLARSLHRVLIVDAGRPAHASAPHMHNMIGADGLTPAAFYANAHAQLDAYPHVTRVAATVVDGLVYSDFSFGLTDHQGGQHHAGTVLFACGVRDVLPPIDGLAPLWGKQVQHCAFCHGYEARGKVSAVLTPRHAAMDMVAMLHHLTPSLHVLLEDGPADETLAAELQRLGVSHRPVRIQRIEPHPEAMTLYGDDGTAQACEVLYIRPGSAAATTLPQTFGCSMTAGGQIEADRWGRTGIRGVYAAGDVATGQTAQLVHAMSSGLTVAVAIDSQLRTPR